MTKHYKVYVVGTHDCASTWIGSVFTSKKRALKRWNEYRHELIADFEEQLLENRKNGLSTEIEEVCIGNLLNNDPSTMDNFPHEQPYIKEMIVE